MPIAFLRPRGATVYVKLRPSNFLLSESEELDHAKGAPGYVVVTSGGGLSEEYGHSVSGVSLGTGKTEVEISRRKLNAAMRCSGGFLTRGLVLPVVSKTARLKYLFCVTSIHVCELG